MSLTASEAEALINKAQVEQSLKWYVKNPVYLRGLSVEERRAQLTDSDIEWSEGVPSGTVVDGYEIEHVKSIGGEGQGNYAAEIYRVGDQLFRIEGFYSSYEGTDWDEHLHEVEAYEVTVVKYRKKK